MTPASQSLALHGAIVLSFGMLLGAAYASAVKRDAADAVIHAWGRAHFGLPLGGTAMLALAMLLAELHASPRLEWLIAGGFVAAGYGHAVALPLAAFTRQHQAWSVRTALRRLMRGARIVGWSGLAVGCTSLIYASTR